MSPYIAIVSARIRTLLQYRIAALAGMLTQLFWGLIRTMLFTALYSSSSVTQPLTYGQAVDYIWLGQAMFAVTMLTIDQDFQEMVRTGTVAYELLRPIDLYGLWYCRAISKRISLIVLRSLPIFLIALLLLDLHPPSSLAACGAWAIATLGALVLTSAISTLGSITLLWTIAGNGINQLLNVAVLIFSGIIVPLPFFPDWLQPLLNFLPFRDLLDAPLRFYIGQMPPESILILAAHQLAWILGLIILGRLMLAAGLRRLVIQGG
ncbi:MAG: ABC-2 family transporter protein [Prochloron sp. SP5CPC1]|nr:ABC-2 family transporter protein [Candidatus Paraprochloron terpiosi SP5CPC1]